MNLLQVCVTAIAVSDMAVVPDNDGKESQKKNLRKLHHF